MMLFDERWKSALTITAIVVAGLFVIAQAIRLWAKSICEYFRSGQAENAHADFGSDGNQLLESGHNLLFPLFIRAPSLTYCVPCCFK
jgi:hypothetical protein